MTFAVGLVAPLLLAAPAATADRTPAAVISPAQMHAALAQRRGHVVLLHLWATWCLPCLAELPVVARFAREMRPKGVDVYSVSLDDAAPRGGRRVAKVLADRAGDALTKVIVKVDDPDAFVNGIDPRWEGDIPALFVFDREGKLRRAHTGLADRALLDALVADTPTPAPTR